MQFYKVMPFVILPCSYSGPCDLDIFNLVLIYFVFSKNGFIILFSWMFTANTQTDFFTQSRTEVDY